ncbi:MAG: bifunctional riboflavin kinase/FAD synthetase [Vicinamibacterales bacterium]
MERSAFDVVTFPDERRPVEWRLPVVAIGNFDGVHRGHQKILERICRRAAERSGTPLVLTFEPHPPRVVRPDKAPPLLMTPAQKAAALGRSGVAGVANVRFTMDVSQWEPERFVREVLVEWLHVAEVWVGANFLFGRDRSGNFTLLRTLGAQHGFRVEKIDPVRYKEFIVSSTRVRRLISEGRVDEAAALLGRHYMLEGRIEAGAARGRTLGFPTANLVTENELLPPDGVYATFAMFDGRTRGAVTNIGLRPTFGQGGRTVETHVLDFSGDLYGTRMELAFVQRLRDERSFADLDALTAQIATDVRRARDLFRQVSL